MISGEEFERLVDLVYPESKLTIPVQFCKWCDVKKTTSTHFPYCSAECERAQKGKR